MDVHISRQGNIIGVFNNDLLQELVAKGIIQSSDLAWKQGEVGWQPVTTLFPHLKVKVAKTTARVPSMARAPAPVPRQTSPPTSRPETVVVAPSNAALIAGWILFGVGVLIMMSSLWLFVLYGALFLIALVLGIVAISQRKLAGGLILVVAVVIAVPIICLALGLTRTTTALENTTHDLQNFQSEMESDFHRATSPENVPSGRGNQLAVQRSLVPALPAMPAVDNTNLLQADLRGLDARTLRLANFYVIENKDVVAPCQYGLAPLPAFSNDCRLLAYVRFEPRRERSIVVIDLVTLKKTKVIRPSMKPVLLLWSPDATRIIYVGEDNSSYLLDLKLGTESRLPLQNVSLKSQNISLKSRRDKDEIWWKTLDDIFMVRGDSVWHVSLQTLSATQKNFDSQEEADEFMRPATMHPKTIVVQDDMGKSAGKIPPSLALKNLDGSFTKPIMGGIYGSHPFVASLDLHCIVVYRDDMELLFLEPIAAPQYLWSISLTVNSLLSAEKQGKLTEYLTAGIPFHAGIYQAAINPVNQAIVGPDRKILKGVVTVRQWKDDHVILETTNEYQPFLEGDVVAELCSEQSTKFGNHPFDEFEEQWFRLQRVDQSVALKEEEQEKRNVAQAADRFRNKFPKVHAALKNRTWARGSTQKGTQLEFKAVTFDPASGEFTGVLKNDKETGQEELEGKLSDDGSFIFRTWGHGLTHGFWKGRVDASAASISGNYVYRLMLAGTSVPDPSLGDPSFTLTIE